MNPDTQETWPPPPVEPETVDTHIRTQGIELSISGDVLTFRMLFIRAFVMRFAVFMIALIPVLLIVPYAGYVRIMGISVLSQLGPALWQRLVQILPAIWIVVANIAFLGLIYETMLLQGLFRFDREKGKFWAGLMPHSAHGLRYVAVRRQVSKTKTWTRWCFYLGFDHDVAAAFDRFNPLHRLVAIYGEASRSEYYLGYITDQDAAARAVGMIARFMGVEARVGE